jgi:hypothetical protein
MKDQWKEYYKGQRLSASSSEEVTFTSSTKFIFTPTCFIIIAWWNILNNHQKKYKEDKREKDF